MKLKAEKFHSGQQLKAHKDPQFTRINIQKYFSMNTTHPGQAHNTVLK